MKSYSEITTRYLNENKKRTVLTIIGIILAISLFSGIGNLFFNMRDGLVDRKRKSVGNYEVKYCEINKDKTDKLKNNFEISSYGISKENTILGINDGKDKKIVSLDLYDDGMLSNVMTIDIKEGRLPKNSNEIILEKRSKRKFKKEVGDYVQWFKLDSDLVDNEIKNNPEVIKEIKNGNLNIDIKKFSLNQVKKYKIVGYYEPDKSFSSNYYKAIGYLNKSSLNKDDKYSFYANLKEKKDKRKIGIKVGKTIGVSETINSKGEQITFNEGLLRIMAQGNSTILNKSTKNIFIFVVGLIVICTVAVIYNAFNISVAERINQFGTLRSIGATPRQIRNLVFKEAFIMSIIAIPLGILAGYIGIYITLKIMPISNLFIFEGLNIKFYKEVIVICIILTLITILLSVIGPARKASKVSPIDAIRNSSNLKKEKIKRRKGRISKLLFGIEGSVAYKNIRRNNKRFIITVFSLMISLIMFILFSSLSKLTLDAQKKFTESFAFDALMETKSEINKEFISKIKNREGIKEVYTPKIKSGLIYIKENMINKKPYKDANAKQPTSEKIKNENYVSLYAFYTSYDYNSLKLAKNNLKAGNVDIDALNKNGVLIIDTNKISKKNGGKIVSNITKYKVGDKIKIPKSKEMFYPSPFENKKVDLNKPYKQSIENGEFMEFTVVGILEKDEFNKLVPDSVGLVFSEKCFENNFGKIPLNSVFVSYKDKNAREKNFAFFEDGAEELNGSYIDLYKKVKEMESVEKQIAVFIYGFITIITIIGIVNIINTISMGLLLRKSEFATLMAIGMTKKQLKKMVILEGGLHGIITSIFGIIISLGLYNLLLQQVKAVADFEIKFPIGIFLLGVLGVMIVTFVASIVPLRRLEKMSIVDNIRAKE
ncbi:ABC transporter permease [Clostridium niameyense]|uniref:ABC transporter permease n=1 Tax=Clostridium niameyense TaxID=1622073 RepID=UPI00067F5A8B|nr:ABC transporter permease [Clostridium niameyense]